MYFINFIWIQINHTNIIVALSALLDRSVGAINVQFLDRYFYFLFGTLRDYRPDSRQLEASSLCCLYCVRANGRPKATSTILLFK
jgi:hypothetical protein